MRVKEKSSRITVTCFQAFGEPSFQVPVSGELDLRNAHHILMIVSFLTYCVRLIQVPCLDFVPGSPEVICSKHLTNDC